MEATHAMTEDLAALAAEAAGLGDRLTRDPEDAAAAAALADLGRRLGLAPGIAPLPLPPVANPRVSILLLAWNQLPFTRRCLAALRRSVPAGLAEVVLVDNGSTDGTAAWARRQPDVRLLRNEENRGFGPANNQAAEQARGEYLLLLNNDTEPQFGFLERLVAALDADPGLGAATARLFAPSGELLEAGATVNLDATCTNRGRGAPGGIHSYREPVEVDYASACCLLVRRDAFRAAGGFDPRFAPAYYEDVDLCVTLRRQGWRLAVVPEAACLHAESVTARRLAGHESRRLRLQEEARRTFLAKWRDGFLGEAGAGPAGAAVATAAASVAASVAVAAGAPSAAASQAGAAAGADGPAVDGPAADGPTADGLTVDGPAAEAAALAAARAPLLPAPIRVAILTPRYAADCLWGEAMISSELREALEWRPDVREARVFSYADADEMAGWAPDLVFSFTAWRWPLRFPRAITLFYVVNFTHELMPPGRFLTWDDALRLDADVYAANTPAGVAILGRHKPAALLHMAASARVHRPRGVDPRYRAQVTYLGSYNPGTKGAACFDRYVAPAAEFDLALWGEMWERAPALLRRRWRGVLPIPDIARLYSSVDVAIGFNAESQARAGMINNRVFEVLACGALLLSDRVPAIEELFGDCAVFTDGYADTREKLAHYLARPEERAPLIARARAKILSGHTYDHRAREIIQLYADAARAKGRL